MGLGIRGWFRAKFLKHLTCQGSWAKRLLGPGARVDLSEGGSHT